MLPMYSPDQDPGPSFLSLRDRQGMRPADVQGGGHDLTVTHATTVVAVRFVHGVIMAGDRRATAGNLITHRDMEKVYPADRHSAVAIAGAAGPAMEMVRLYQLQLEHYEKVEGQALSLEGKANQLSAMVRGNLGMAMQGFIVVPLFAGFDLRRGVGRLFQFDVTGGRYEEANYASTGSGSLFASTVVKLGYRPDMTREEGVDLVLSALFQAADEDSATGGPDLVRKIFPIVALVTVEGFTRLDDAEIEERFRDMAERLSPQTAAPQGRPEGDPS